MTLRKDEGVVLRRRDFGETSRIATVYTKNYGKIQVNAKGARKPKSKFGAALEPLTRVEIVYYHRETKDLYTLSEASIITPHQILREDPTKFIYASAMVEAVDRLTRAENNEPVLYRLMGRSFIALETGASTQLTFAYFLLRLCAATGFNPDFSSCSLCGEVPGNKPLVFTVQTGKIACDNCTTAMPDDFILSPKIYALIRTLMDIDYRKLHNQVYSPKDADAIIQLLLLHLRYHTNLQLKTLRFGETLLDLNNNG